MSQNIAVETKQSVRQNWLLKCDCGVKDPLVCSMSLGNDAFPIERFQLQLPQPGRHTLSTSELAWTNFKQTGCAPQQTAINCCQNLACRLGLLCASSATTKMYHDHRNMVDSTCKVAD